MEPALVTDAVLKPGTYQGVPPTSPGKNVEPLIPLVRTMKNDIAEVIAKQKETVASIALAEAKKQERLRAEALAAKQAQIEVAPPAPKRHSRIFIIIIIILLLIAGRIVYKLVATNIPTITLPLSGFLGFGGPSPEKPVATTTQEIVIPALAPALIPPQAEKRFSLSNETPDHVSAMIAVERTAGLTLGTIKNFYFTEYSSLDATSTPQTSVSANRILAFMGTAAPDGLLRSLEAPFMIGLLGENGSIAASFVVLKVSDPDISRAAMLSWEPTLAQNFDNIFGSKIAINIAGATKFKDLVIGGRDARVLGTLSGPTVAYAFVDSSTIVISSNSTSLATLIQLLAK